MSHDVEPETIERATSTVARVLGELDQAHPGLSGEIVAALVRADVLAPRVIDLGAENPFRGFAPAPPCACGQRVGHRETERCTGGA